MDLFGTGNKDDDHQEDAISRYMRLTREVLPRMAREPGRNWPVREDHCFQRIVLDAVCGGVWHTKIPRPAYRHLSTNQARLAVALCEDIITGKADLRRLNAQSLAWRGKA